MRQAPKSIISGRIHQGLKNALKKLAKKRRTSVSDLLEEICLEYAAVHGINYDNKNKKGPVGPS